MIVALRISTGGFGCRLYVEGYCGPNPAVSCIAAAGAAPGGGAAAGAACAVVVGRAPPDAHAASAASNPNPTSSGRIAGLLLFHEFENQGRSSRRDADQPARRLLRHIHHDRQLQPGELE